MHKNTRKEDWNNSTNLNYPLLYGQRWIPFNAWYSTVIDGKKDADAIGSFKVETNNKLYDIIKLYIQHPRGDFYGEEFCFHLSCLDELLTSNCFPNIDDRIIFGDTKIKQNEKREATANEKGLSYKVERDPPDHPKKSVRIIILDLATRKVKHTFIIAKHDMNLLREQFEKNRISKSERKKVMLLFKEIEPIVTVDVKNTKGGSIRVGMSKFISETNVLCAAIVDVLYELRCKAVHGETDLDKTTCEVYEHAYFMLECILRKLF